MKITAIRAYQVDLPYVGGTYFWGKGNAIRVASTTVMVVETDAAVSYTHLTLPTIYSV